MFNVRRHAVDRFIQRSKTKYKSRSQAKKNLLSLLHTKKDGEHTFICENRIWTYVIRRGWLTTVFYKERLSKVDLEAKKSGRKITQFVRMK